MSPKPIFERHYAAPGASPGEISAERQGGPLSFYIMQYDEQRLEEWQTTDAKALNDLKRGKLITWIDVRGGVDRALLDHLGELFDLHPLALADVANLGQRPKAENYDTTLFCVVRMATHTQEEGVQWEQVSLFLGPDFVLTFQETVDDCLDPLRERIRKGKRIVRTHKHDYLATMVIDAIVDGYFPIVEIYGDQLEVLEHGVLTNPDREDLNEIYRIKRELMIFRRAAWPLRDALSLLQRDRPHLLGKTVDPYLRDTIDHLMQIVDVVETYRDLSTSFVDVYMSSVSFRTNEIMRLLTVIASIFIPLTFVAGVYGMNFDAAYPLNMPELHWRFGYVGFWVICALVAGGLSAMFYRLGWLGKPQ